MTSNTICSSDPISQILHTDFGSTLPLRILVTCRFVYFTFASQFLKFRRFASDRNERVRKRVKENVAVKE
ncbi:hypothetical protein B4U80_10843 [Leptotrombidium deliense]|uniref:Uncharacterized protein n=1 Tax=Leptotrombidium deliense TaxID=299467 RepID=A0A443SHG3_9ACAR|nr:hypothetical protein B4U80_10843 [Leptotrombidium deliense]